MDRCCHPNENLGRIFGSYVLGPAGAFAVVCDELRKHSVSFSGHRFATKMGTGEKSEYRRGQKTNQKLGSIAL
jgi:hypothetical protein